MTEQSTNDTLLDAIEFLPPFNRWIAACVLGLATKPPPHKYLVAHAYLEKHMPGIELLADTSDFPPVCWGTAAAIACVKGTPRMLEIALAKLPRDVPSDFHTFLLQKTCGHGNFEALDVLRQKFGDLTTDRYQIALKAACVGGQIAMFQHIIGIIGLDGVSRTNVIRATCAGGHMPAVRVVMDEIAQRVSHWDMALRFALNMSSFEAHSVVVTYGGYGPEVCWGDVARLVGDVAPFSGGLDPGAIPPPLVGECKKITGQSNLIAMQFGTIVGVDDVRGGPFPGFATPGSTYAIPCHRFRHPTQLEQLRYGGVLLRRAQLTWERDLATLGPAKAAVAHQGLRTFQAVKYPLPGCDESDGDVVAAWRGPAVEGESGRVRVAAAVRLRKFPRNVGVFVEADAPSSSLGDPAEPELPPSFLKELANIGRENFRQDYLQPMVVTVW